METFTFKMEGKQYHCPLLTKKMRYRNRNFILDIWIQIIPNFKTLIKDTKCIEHWTFLKEMTSHSRSWANMSEQQVSKVVGTIQWRVNACLRTGSSVCTEEVFLVLLCLHWVASGLGLKGKKPNYIPFCNKAVYHILLYVSLQNSSALFPH